MSVTIEGTCDAKFKALRDGFAENFENCKEVGAALSVTLEGKAVVDLWAGYANRKKARPWTHDTIVNAFSATKGLTAMCAHRLADQGKLDFDATVARYWPEFARAGKSEIPVRWLMTHSAGLPAIRKQLPVEAVFDWGAMTAALAEQEPWWTPGTLHGYHVLTFGWLVGEVVRRISGKSLGTFFRDEIAGPLGLDAHIGLDAANDSRIAELIPAATPAPGESRLFDLVANNPDCLTARAFSNPPIGLRPGLVHSREWRGAEIPAANGHTNARALARLYGALAKGGSTDGYRVLSAESIGRCYAEQAYGVDQVLQVSTRVSMGFMMSQPNEAMGPNTRAFGHSGAGGSLGFADPDARLGFGYTMNQMGNDVLIDARVKALLSVLYGAL